jgi:hypothetical protein
MIDQKVYETLTLLFIGAEGFNPDDWEQDSTCLYYLHKTKRFIVDGEKGAKQEVPYMISVKALHAIANYAHIAK